MQLVVQVVRPDSIWFQDAWLVTGSDNNQVTNKPGKLQVWEVKTGVCVAELTAHQSR